MHKKFYVRHFIKTSVIGYPYEDDYDGEIEDDSSQLKVEKAYMQAYYK